MKVIALLSWYDEPPSWLAATIASCAPFCDHVVACDGAYALFPSGPRSGGSSGSHQHEELAKICEAAGLGLTLHVPSGPWEGNEVEKRSMLFRLAEAIAEPEVDWLFTVDADEVVLEAPPDLRQLLGETELDCAEVTLMQVTWRDVGEWSHHRQEASASYLPVRQFFRALPGMRVEGQHHFYRAERDGRTLWLRGSPGYPLEPALSLPGVLIDHRNHLRSGRRQDLSGRYYEARDRLGMEAPPAELAEAR